MNWYIFFLPLLAIVVISLTAFALFLITVSIPTTRQFVYFLLEKRNKKLNNKSYASNNSDYKRDNIPYIKHFAYTFYKFWIKGVFGSNKIKTKESESKRNQSVSNTLPKIINITIPKEFKDSSQSIDSLHAHDSSIEGKNETTKTEPKLKQGTACICFNNIFCELLSD